MDLEKIRAYQRAFVLARDWERYHTPKNLACAMSVECSELLEILQWTSDAEGQTLQSDPEKMQRMREEIADVLYYLLRLSDVLSIDIEQAFWDKTKQNEKKYPVELSKGNAKKYTEL